MKVYEFYMKSNQQKVSFQSFCEYFYGLGNEVKRKVDGENAKPIYAISWNRDTQWVQLLVDDNADASSLTEIETAIKSYSDWNDLDTVSKEAYVEFDKRESSVDSKLIDNVAPVERPKSQVITLKTEQKIPIAEK